MLKAMGQTDTPVINHSPVIIVVLCKSVLDGQKWMAANPNICTNNKVIRADTVQKIQGLRGVDNLKFYSTIAYATDPNDDMNDMVESMTRQSNPVDREAYIGDRRCIVSDLDLHIMADDSGMPTVIEYSTEFRIFGSGVFDGVQILFVAAGVKVSMSADSKHPVIIFDEPFVISEASE